MKMIDAHIHLDKYADEEIRLIIEKSNYLDSLVSVSYDLESCKRNLQLSKKYDKVKPVFGFHPEQQLLTASELSLMIEWMTANHTEMIAVGEVGLPFYSKADGRISSLQFEQYKELLEQFIVLAKKWDKPIVLHAVYDDAPIVCDLLEIHSVIKAHFHWFKGDDKIIRRMAENGYYISVTPEIVYREKIKKVAQMYPIEQIMVETDGPWPFEGPFSGKMTHPFMMKQSIATIAKIKDLSESDVAEKIIENTREFFLI